MWRLTKNVAQLQSGFLSACVDASCPDRGIHVELLPPGNPRQPVGSLFRILFQRAPQAPALRLTEVYERVNDLVASYEELADPQVRPQVYWRYVRSQAVESALGIEIIVSVQTSTLDCRPTVIVESKISSDRVEVFHWDGQGALQLQKTTTTENPPAIAPHACLFSARVANANLTYLEMADPADFHGTQIVSSSAGSDALSELSIQHQLQTDRLEKGVIRRCRVRCLLVPSHNDEAVAQRCYEEFLNSPLPLTT